MAKSSLKILAVVGSLNKNSVTRVVINHVAAELKAARCAVDVLDLLQEPLELYSPDASPGAKGFESLQARVEAADVYVLGTPDYHGSISSALKNFLDHFWHEFTGKLFATVVSSQEKGLTVADQLRTVARQCYAWSLPYGVSFVEREDVKNGAVVSEALKGRLAMLVRDVGVYGRLLARQRRVDLAGSDPGFMARLRNRRGG
ncbi:MAG: NAD(P)H-dependent oxidoreductase [Verrucomicrobiota bacterium]